MRFSSPSPSSPPPKGEKSQNPKPKNSWLVLFLLFLLWIPGFWPAQAFSAQVVNDVLATRPFTHQLWNQVLRRRFANDGSVDFAGLRAEPGRFNAYLSQLAQYSPENHPEYFPKSDDALAYWINAYNALTLRLALDHYPASPEDLMDMPARQIRYPLGGRIVSLSELRERITDQNKRYPSLLFALTDYTVGAPPLLPQAYEGRLLATQLTQAMELSLRDTNLIRYYETADHCPSLELSTFWKTLGLRDNPENAALLNAGDPDAGADWEGDNANWAAQFKPFAPSQLFARWNAPCKHELRFHPAQPKLRIFAEPDGSET
jgi:hypothetical protein